MTSIDGTLALTSQPDIYNQVVKVMDKPEYIDTVAADEDPTPPNITVLPKAKHIATVKVVSYR